MGRRPRSIAIAPLVVLVGMLCFAAAPARVAGKITKVDVDSRSMTVTDAGGAAHVLYVDEQSVIALDGDEQATLDDLFEGDDVVSAEVRELNSGRIYLVRAVVTSQPKPPEDPDGGE